MDRFLLKRLICPDTKQPLLLLDKAALEKLNRLMSEKKILPPEGLSLDEPLTEALVRADRAVIYPIVHDIPLLAPDSKIVANGLLTLTSDTSSNKESAQPNQDKNLPYH